MRILFVHQNSPGQYVHLMRWAKATPGIVPAAITEQSNLRADSVPTIRYKFKPSAQGPTTAAAKRFSDSIIRAESCAKAAILYRDKGFVPDIILGHGAWGETFYLKEVFPNAKLISYAEFYYRSHGQNIGFDPEFDSIATSTIRTVSTQNATMTTSLLASDLGQVPTQFQASTFPTELRQKLKVLFDGIDTDVLVPDNQAQFTLPNGQVLRSGDPVITFINRNFEPYRGYHTFMRALPEIQRRNPKAHVILVGGDGVSYGAPPPDGASWKSIYLDEVRSSIDMSRVHFVGQVTTHALRQIYQVSAVHVYLTYPFVLSWSMMEAMSAGCLVVGADVAPVREMVTHDQTGLLTDFFDIERLAETVVQTLSKPHEYSEIRKKARQTIVENYDLKSRCLPAQIDLINETLAI